jgi:hypothetical protein
MPGSQHAYKGENAQIFPRNLLATAKIDPREDLLLIKNRLGLRNPG